MPLQYSQNGTIELIEKKNKDRRELMADPAFKSTIYRERLQNIKQAAKKKKCYLFIDEQKSDY